MTQLSITFTGDVTAADAGRRTITGQIVPFGRWGQTSAGLVRFERGAFDSLPNVKLLLEHDPRRPIGRAQQMLPTPEGIVATFKLSGTTAATDALIEAADGLRDGLSVGANIIDFEYTDEGMVVTAAELLEVSLVHTPAFSEAVVTQVAASADPDQPAAPSEEDVTVQNETPEVPAAEVVEASRPEPTPAPVKQYIQVGAPRELETLTAGRWMAAKLRADAGDRAAQHLVTAALDDNTTTTAAGLVPTRFLREVIGVLDTSRPFIDSLSRETLPDAGMDFKIPRRTARASVAEQAAQGDEVSSDEPTYDFLTVNVKTFAGGERISRQLIERSDPAFLDRLVLEMASEYAQKVDNFAWLTVANALGAGSNSDGASIAEAVGQAIADSWSVMRFAPNNLAVAPSTTGSFGFADLLKAVDGEDRPLFAATGQLVNGAGAVLTPNASGSVMGLRLVVDGNMAGDSNALVYPSAAATFYEASASPIQVSVQDVSTLEVEVAVYGYVAMAVKYPTAIRYLTITP